MSSQSLSVSGKLISDSGSGSSPDLRTLDDYNVTLRKRKYECDCASLINDFRKEMMSFFQDFTKTQQECSLSLHNEIKEIKDELKSNNAALESLILEQNQTKVDLKEMKSLTDTIEQKIHVLENDICYLKNNSNIDFPKEYPLSCEETISELQERSKRGKNIILVGIPEIKNPNSTIRRDNDKDEAMKLIKTIYEDCPNPATVLRLGKYNPNKDRSLKVCFEKKETAKYILKNKRKHKSDKIRIYADQTQCQQQHMKKLQDELLSRQKNGEKDLIIKYVNDVPKIVKNNPKNSTRQETKQSK